MSSPHDAVVVLSRALDQAGDVLDVVHREHFDLPTPCADWTVRDLVGHLVAGPGNFLAMTRGEEPDWKARPAPGESFAADFRSSADDLIHHWHERPDEEAPQADFQTAEFALHSWDLVRAIGSSMQLRPDVASRALDAMQQALTPDNRGEAFSPPVEVPDDAPVYDRLAAWAGRDPAA